MTYWAEMELPDEFSETLTLTSNDSQWVYISGYTYDEQHTYNGECMNFTSGTNISFTHDKTQSTYWIHRAEQHSEPVWVEAGESFEISIDATWGSGDLH